MSANNTKQLKGSKKQKADTDKHIIKSKTDRELLEESVAKINSLECTLELMRRSMDNTLEKVESLQKELEGKEEKISYLDQKVVQLECKIEELEQRSRMNNIIIRGIKETRGEDTMKLVEEVGHQIGIDNPQNDIQVCHRVPTRNSNMPRPVVVRLLNTKTRDTWVKKAKVAQTWKRKLYMHEHLAPTRQHLFHLAKEMAKKVNYKYVWTKDCRILMKKNDSGRTFVIDNEVTLQRIENNEKQGKGYDIAQDLEETINA